MDIFQFGRIIEGSDKIVLIYFQEHNLIRSGARCVPCGSVFIIKHKGLTG